VKLERGRDGKPERREPAACELRTGAQNWGRQSAGGGLVSIGMALLARPHRGFAIGLAIAAWTTCLILPAVTRAGGVPIQDPLHSWEGQLRYQGEFAGFRIASAPSTIRDRELYVGTVTTPSSDLVFTDAAGVTPPPFPCIQGGTTTIRCPTANLISLDITFSGGNDRLETMRYDLPTIAGIQTSFEMGAGNDIWLGGPLPETWFGGPGNDQGRGGSGSDRFFGGQGNDRMLGGLGIDFFSGGPGRDFARGGAGNDKGSGGPGNDNFKD
jgi:hemolysin type calcium-binding protein